MKWDDFLKKQKLKTLVYLPKEINKLLYDIKEIKIYENLPYQFTILHEIEIDKMKLERWSMINQVTITNEVFWYVVEGNKRVKIENAIKITKEQVEVLDRLFLDYNKERERK